jgi:hypothetical protein
MIHQVFADLQRLGTDGFQAFIQFSSWIRRYCASAMLDLAQVPQGFIQLSLRSPRRRRRKNNRYTRTCSSSKFLPGDYPAGRLLDHTPSARKKTPKLPRPRLRPVRG